MYSLLFISRKRCYLLNSTISARIPTKDRRNEVIATYETLAVFLVC